LDLLTAFPWPGNVRQLEQALFAAAALCEGEEITPANLPAWLHKPGISGVEEQSPSPSGIHHPDMKIDARKDYQFQKDEERTRYLEALNATKYRGTGRWNVSAAARQLGIPRETLAYHLRKLGLFR
jgi:transcriptional regulator of acetoin/glycerol metabolism